MGKLKDGSFNLCIEQSVSKHAIKNFRIDEIIETEANAMHENAIFKGSNKSVFVKAGTNDFSYDQFVQEAGGLTHISEKSEIHTPHVIDVLDADGTALLIMEAVDTKPVEKKKDWETLGRSLALLHKTTWHRCGFETHNYLGTFRQDNDPMDTWDKFYGQRRLRAGMERAGDAGNMAFEHCEALEKLICRLPEVCGPSQPFSLLHGDPWAGNLLYDGEKAIMIDCSIYYGNREIDLSTVDLFCPVPQYFFDAYNEVYPIDHGYNDRKPLWRINQYLALVALFGQEHIPKLMDAVRKYL